jgi:hypothetical protein
MEVNEHLRDEIFEIIEKQMKDNTPPEINLTYERLKGQGYTDFVAKQYIGQCLVIEIFGAIKNHKQYDETRYIKNLKQLPKEPSP